ncbi:hypothetical protein ANN_27335 [Periplaneta americana]|uniref:DDE-1 domain-containing protein n=1 Tax=Periplaneta americana TaxID=6978 RepID=A0ABQ8RXR4_PERAM|nr:hypothetical protein ANN_27335 [Periplaneta americana]
MENAGFAVKDLPMARTRRDPVRPVWRESYKLICKGEVKASDRQNSLKCVKGKRSLPVCPVMQQEEVESISASKYECTMVQRVLRGTYFQTVHIPAITGITRHVIELRQRHSYPLHQISNADETPVFWDMPSNMTVDNKGAKSISLRTTGNEKQRITVMLAVTADGGKLPPYVILKRKTMPKENLPKGLVIRCQEKGWMTTELMVDWLATVWNRRPGALLCKRAMLVLDAFKGHLTPEVKKKITALKTDLVVIPGGMTSKLQVLDVVVNKPFKDHLRKQYSDWLLEGSHAFTPPGNIKKPSVSLMCEWILSSWHTISPDSIIKGFKKCCVSNALDGSEDDVLWAESDEQSDSDETNTGTGRVKSAVTLEKTVISCTGIFGDLPT